MRHIWKLVLMLLLSTPLQAQTGTKFYKMYDGSIAGMPAQLHLIRDGNILSGHYYYMDFGLLVNVDGEVDDIGIFKMKEWSYTEQLDGFFTGIVDSTFNKLAGTWYNSDSSVQISFLFDEVEPPVKFQIATNVGESESSTCYRKLLSYTKERQPKPHAEACLCCETVVYNNHNLVSTKTVENFGERKISYAVYNAADLRKLNLGDLFERKYKKAITKQAAKVLRVKYEMRKRQRLTKKGFYKKKIEPDNNFYITPQAIVFVYNPGEIAPAEMGVIEIWISFSSMKKYIRKDGALKWTLE